MRVRLLGPVDVVGGDGSSRSVSGLRRKAVLAVLALRVGEIVSTDRLIEVVWGEDAAPVVNTVQSHVSYLRRVLGDPAAIQTRPPGYLLALAPDGTDVVVAERLILAARQSGDPARSAELLRSALGLWRGRPLVDVADVSWLNQQSDRLAALEFDARRALVDARLAMGEHLHLLSELRHLAGQHPFDEQVQGQLVLALYRAGRQAEALAVLREVRTSLGAELGIDPGPALRELEAAVLRQDPVLAPVAGRIEVLPSAVSPQQPIALPRQQTPVSGPRTARPRPALVSGQNPAPRRHPAALPGGPADQPAVTVAPGGLAEQPTVPGAPRGAVGALVGRAHESSVLDGLLDQLGAGTALVVAISGDPGIGKTRLLRELTRRAELAGRPVAWGRAAEFEQHIPFAIVSDVLADPLADLGPDSLAGLSSAQLTMLREILPIPPGAGARQQPGAEADGQPWPAAGQWTAADTSHPDRPSLGPERYRLHRAVRALLETMAGPVGLVVVLDDLHWADPSSAELLEYLLRHPPAGPVLLAVSYRPRQLSGRLRQRLARAVDDGVVTSLELGPLTPTEADELLPVRLSPTRRRELYQASGGNPFYLQALTRTDFSAVSSWAAAPDAAGPPDPRDALPPHVQAALVAELDTLTPVEARVAWATALTPEVAEPELVAETAELSIPEVLEALDRLVALDILRPTPRRDRFGFRHPLVRRATYEAADPGWRIGAHARAAQALEQRGAAIAEQAHHLERCATRGDEQAVEVLRRAATEALNSSPAVAAHWLGTALRLLPTNPTSAWLRVELLGARAQALAVTGQLRESRDTLHELLHLLPIDAADLRARLVALCAGIERLLGRHAEANARLAAELAGLTDHEGLAAAMLLLGLASDFATVDLESDHNWAARAVAAARRSGDRPLLAAALATSVLTDQRTARVSANMVERLNEAAALIDAMPDGELAELLHAAAWLATAELCHGRPHDALRHAERTLETAVGSGQTALAGQIHALRACAHRSLGDLPEAARCLEDARDASALVDADELTALVLAYQCNVAALQGDLDLAFRLGKEALDLVGARKGFFTRTAVGALAQAHLHAGDPAGCVGLLLGDTDGRQLADADPVTRGAWYLALAQAEAAQGHPEQALRWAERAQVDAAVAFLPRLAASAQLARAYALLATDPVRAAAHARTAAESLADYGDRIGSGQAYLAAGTALAAIGDADSARDRFARARALFSDCGAHLLALQVRREENRLAGLEVSDQFCRHSAPSLAGRVPGSDRGEQRLGLSGGQALLGSSGDEFQQHLVQLGHHAGVFLAEGAAAVDQDPQHSQLFVVDQRT
jgi:DNA-binding SARP family transcriptional activator